MRARTLPYIACFIVLLAAGNISAAADPDESGVSADIANINALSMRVDAFHKTYGRLPTSEEGLDVLVKKPAVWLDAIPWKGHLNSSNVPRDRWGNAFVYVTDPAIEKGYMIYSEGQDGVSASSGYDADDVNPVNPERPWIEYYQKRRRRDYILSWLICLLAIGTAAFACWHFARKGIK
jgi:general secretion pathway protein G